MTMARLLPRLGLSAASLVLGLLLAEAALRVFGVSYPIFFQVDPVTGTSLIPGTRGVYSQEGLGAFVEINEDGWRGPDRVVDKPAGTFRIALLGDSFVGAFEVEWEKTFGQVLEQSLRERGFAGGAVIEVLNFGVPGWGPTQELLTLRNRVWKYDPDLVLLAFCTANDIWNSGRALKSEYMPTFYVENGTLHLDGSFAQSTAYQTRDGLGLRMFVRASRYSRILQVVNRVRHQVRDWRREAESSGTAPDESVEPGVPNKIYFPPEDPDWIEAWRNTEATIAEIHAESREAGVPFALVTLTNAVQVEPVDELGEALAGALGVDDLYYPDDRIAALAEREGFPALGLVRAFDDRARREGRHIHGFGASVGRGHWNDVGHRWAGERIAEWLSEPKQPDEEESAARWVFPDSGDPSPR